MARKQAAIAALLWSVTAALLLGYAGFAWRMFVNDAFVPDEHLFLAIARSKGEAGETLLVTENTLGYGAAYWMVFDLVGRLSPLPALLSMRIFALLAMITIPVSLIWIAAKQGQPIAALAAVSLWIALPMAWWDGKLAGPDVFSYVAAYLGLFLAATKASWRRPHLVTALGGVLLGIGIGLKPTAVVGLVAALVILMLARAERLPARCMHALRLGAGAVAGFLAANPFFALYPQAFFGNLEENRRAAPGNAWAQLRQMFFADAHTWDGVLSGGFTKSGYSLAALCLLFAVVYWADRKKERAASLLAAFLAAGLLILLSDQRFLGWYWFPFLALTPFYVAALEFDIARRRPFLASVLLLVSLCALQAVNNAGTIVDAYQNRMAHVRALAAQDEVKRCLDDQVGPLRNYNAIYALLDPGVSLRAGRSAIESFEGYRALQERRGIDEMRAKGEPFLLLLSRRLGALNGLNFDAYESWQGVRIGECNGVRYLAFRPRDLQKP